MWHAGRYTCIATANENAESSHVNFFVTDVKAGFQIRQRDQRDFFLILKIIFTVFKRYFFQIFKTYLKILFFDFLVHSRTILNGELQPHRKEHLFVFV